MEIPFWVWENGDWFQEMINNNVFAFDCFLLFNHHSSPSLWPPLGTYMLSLSQSKSCPWCEALTAKFVLPMDKYNDQETLFLEVIWKLLSYNFHRSLLTLPSRDTTDPYDLWIYICKFTYSLKIYLYPPNQYSQHFQGHLPTCAKWRKIWATQNIHSQLGSNKTMLCFLVKNQTLKGKCVCLGYSYSNLEISHCSTSIIKGQV